MRELIIHDVPLFEGQVKLAVCDGRPYMPLGPVCAWLQIPVESQLRRIQRHMTRCNLAAVLLDDVGWAIPLEDVSWFLRTLKPRLPDPHQRWKRTREVLCWLLIDFYVRSYQRYFTPEIREQLIDREFLPDRAYSTARLTTGDADRIKELRAEGWTFTRLSKLYRYSTGTLCQICHDKYPVKLKEGPPGPQYAVLRSGLNASTASGRGEHRGNHPPGTKIAPDCDFGVLSTKASPDVPAVT